MNVLATTPGYETVDQAVFSVLLSTQVPLVSFEIAEKAKKRETTVRKVLGSMVRSGLVLKEKNPGYHTLYVLRREY